MISVFSGVFLLQNYRGSNDNWPPRCLLRRPSPPTTRHCNIFYGLKKLSLIFTGVPVILLKSTIVF